MRIYFKITTDSPFPIATEGHVECSGWQIAARQAVNSHKNTLREKGKLRKWGETTIIKMTKLPD
jgi:hypothetical protein